MKILLIDDDLSFLEVMERSLRHVNYDCVSFQNPVDALAAYQAEQYDVVITDILMPQMDGIDVLRAVKGFNSEARVIMLTGYANMDTTQSALNQGAYAYFQKPFELTNILDTLRKIEKELVIEKENKRKIQMFDENECELDEVYQDLQKHVVAVDQLHAISRKIHAAIDLDCIMQELVNNVCHLLGCRYGLICFYDQKPGKCNCFHSGKEDDGKTGFEDFCPLEKFPFKSCFCQKKILLDNQPCPDTNMVLEPLSISLQNYVCVPLIRRGRAIGILAGLNKNKGFTGRDKFMLNAISDMAVTAIYNSGLIGQLKELFGQTVEALAKGIEARDEYTRGHTNRVSRYTEMIARALNWNDEKLYEAHIGSTLHDIGKIGIPDRILNKPGRLTGEEFAMIKQHVVIGVEILKDVYQLKKMMPYIQHHHERYDGSGYPQGLKGKEIPLEGRIMCVADSFDAMTSNRPYRGHLCLEEAVSELEKCSGLQFDPGIVEVFISLLNSGELDNIVHENHHFAASKLHESS